MESDAMGQIIWHLYKVDENEVWYLPEKVDTGWPGVTPEMINEAINWCVSRADPPVEVVDVETWRQM